MFARRLLTAAEPPRRPKRRPSAGGGGPLCEVRGTLLVSVGSAGEPLSSWQHLRRNRSVSQAAKGRKKGVAEVKRGRSFRTASAGRAGRGSAPTAPVCAR